MRVQFVFIHLFLFRILNFTFAGFEISEGEFKERFRCDIHINRKIDFINHGINDRNWRIKICKRLISNLFSFIFFFFEF